VPSTPKEASHLLTVVIASLCEEARAELLKRAIASIRDMAAGADYSIIVVANGPRVSEGVLQWLSSVESVRVIRLRTGSHPLARRVGAELAKSEFLAFLDDDDELVPNTLARKIAYFREHPEVDVLVTDGWRVAASGRTRIFPAPDARSEDLVETMMTAGWQAGAITLRAGNIDLSAFDPELRHLEWTLTTLLLARSHRVGFLDEATYVYYQDTPNSLSKLAEHSLAAPEVWRRLARSYAGTRYEQIVRRRYGRHCRNACWQHACDGKISEAWRLYLESLRAPGGLASLPMSAKLLLASVRSLLGGSAKDGTMTPPALPEQNVGAQNPAREGPARGI